MRLLKFLRVDGNDWKYNYDTPIGEKIYANGSQSRTMINRKLNGVLLLPLKQERAMVIVR